MHVSEEEDIKRTEDFAKPGKQEHIMHSPGDTGGERNLFQPVLSGTHRA